MMEWAINQSGDVGLLARTLFEGGIAKTPEEGAFYANRELKRGDTYLVAQHPTEGAQGAGLVSFLQEGADRHGLIELNHICVLPDFRGQGLAGALFARLEEEAKAFFADRGSALRKIWLKTHDSNETAQAFYKKLGFNQEAVLPNHYKRGVDEFVFAKYYD